MAVQLLLAELVLQCQRVPERGGSHLIARDPDIDSMFGPVDVLHCKGRKLDPLPRPPVPGSNDEIADVSVDVVGQKIFYVAEVAVRCVDVIADRVAQLSRRS